MKRLAWIVAILAIALMPIAGQAQESPSDTLVAAVTAGLDGEWVVGATDTSQESEYFWAASVTFVGPQGANVIVAAKFVGTSLDAHVLIWQKLVLDWKDDSRMPNRNDSFISTPFPEGATDGHRAEGNDRDSGLAVGHGLYGSATLNIAVTIRAEGTVNGLTGVAATDFIAGLYFAALSDQ